MWEFYTNIQKCIYIYVSSYVQIHTSLISINLHLLIYFVIQTHTHSPPYPKEKPAACNCPSLLPRSIHSPVVYFTHRLANGTPSAQNILSDVMYGKYVEYEDCGIVNDKHAIDVKQKNNKLIS